MSGFLLDTNVISELVKPKPAAKVVRWVDSVDESLMYLSVLTLGEIRKGVSLLQEPARKAKLEAWLDHDLQLRFEGRILPIDRSVAERWGRLDATASHSKIPLPVIDGLLAATALDNGLTLVTRNTADVAGTGVPIFDPWTPPAGI